MKKILMVLLLAVAVCATSIDAEAAKRFGGGFSIGRPAPTMTHKSPAQAPSSAPRQQAAPQKVQPQGAGAAAAARPRSPMMGILGGVAAALGLTALCHALGLQGMENILLIIGVIALVMFLMTRVRRSAANRQDQASQQSVFRNAEPSEPIAQAPAYQDSQVARPGSVMDHFSKQQDGELELEIPAGFDVVGFEKAARENFCQMQQAWDSGNLKLLSSFTTNDLFIAITHQLHDRGAKPQQSEVLDLSAKFLGISREENEYVAVVRFNGAMRVDGEFENVSELWLLTRPLDESEGWLLAGIEQE